ncbi:receptor kinase-like protein Xa21 [Sesamum indicum]|uniref:non-specific serine/threonine protein kinase n=1 Tax=Sesamum indicum TaxID=4182 RepID=A0A6I9UR85_SESIN|nr:receptor kinase-like protein Xa21 [Sesamum indicum]
MDGESLLLQPFLISVSHQPNLDKKQSTQIRGTMLSKSSALSTIASLCFFWFLIFSFPSSCSALETNATDYEALMAFKSHLLLQQDSILATNWSSTAHFCSWFGVRCLNQRVISLLLSGLALQGQLSSDIANMSNLVVIDLSSNDLGGVLPSELGFLQQLRVLNVTKNSLQGRIPANLSQCGELQELDLSYNFIAGSIPEELGRLSNLRHLAVDHNNLTGRIPASLGNFSKLEYFYLHENDLVGEIPVELGKLASVTVMALRGNNHTGSIPDSIFNISTMQVMDLSINGLSGQLPKSLGSHLSSLEHLFLDSNRITGRIPTFLSNASKLTKLFLTENDLSGNIPNEFSELQNLEWFEFEYNQISGGIPYSLFNITSLQILKTRHNYLSGDLPHDLGNWLPNLREIFLSHNQFSGEIPPSICNATKLTTLEASNNSFNGPVPMMLGNLVALEHLNLQVNLLVNNPLSTRLDFFDSLVNCRNLQYLVLDSNPLNGIIPDSVGNLSSNLKVLTAISCKLKGGIPHSIGNLSSLHFLGLSNNNLQGKVPSSFVGLQNLERIYLTGNKLEGTIPTEFCSIQVLGILHLGENSFSGSIPLCFQNLTELREISLAANRLNSTVPLRFWDLVKVEGVNLSRNQLHGMLPVEMGNLKAVNIIDLSSNNFSGEIPNSVGSLQNLLALDMSQNKFQGPIPNSLSNLIVIEFLDLSLNELSGGIPPSLGSLRDLKYLNLSFNMLQGEIPTTGVFTNITSENLMGNPNLCGAPKLNFPMCSARGPGQGKKSSLVLKITIPIAATLLVVICLLVWLSLSRKKHLKNPTGSDSVPIGHQVISYYELLRATESFSESNLLGKGSSGMVYKADLSDGTVAAIKVFNMEYTRALQNFDAECEVLSNVRHRNLVKIISICSNMDFKAMVLEFMPNGSLDKWLHFESNSLSLVQRLDIVIDVAMAIEYLHHDYMMPIVHCDLKPSNVLLDEDMTAHVADFGIAKILAQDEELIRTKTLGTIGYIAPEFGLDGHVSTKVDIYSFGILLLETFTGKRPTDNMFREGLSLHQWVIKSFPGALREVLDPNLIYDLNSGEEGVTKKQSQVGELLVPIIHVALLCLKESPEERIDMRGISVQLKKIRAELKDGCGK